MLDVKSGQHHLQYAHWELHFYYYNWEPTVSANPTRSMLNPLGNSGCIYAGMCKLYILTQEGGERIFAFDIIAIPTL